MLQEAKKRVATQGQHERTFRQMHKNHKRNVASAAVWNSATRILRYNPASLRSPEMQKAPASHQRTFRKGAKKSSPASQGTAQILALFVEEKSNAMPVLESLSDSGKEEQSGLAQVLPKEPSLQLQSGFDSSIIIPSIPPESSPELQSSFDSSIISPSILHRMRNWFAKSKEKDVDADWDEEALDVYEKRQPISSIFKHKAVIISSVIFLNVLVTISLYSLLNTRKSSTLRKKTSDIVSADGKAHLKKEDLRSSARTRPGLNEPNAEPRSASDEPSDETSLAQPVQPTQEKQPGAAGVVAEPLKPAAKSTNAPTKATVATAASVMRPRKRHRRKTLRSSLRSRKRAHRRSRKRLSKFRRAHKRKIKHEQPEQQTVKKIGGLDLSSLNKIH